MRWIALVSCLAIGCAGAPKLVSPATAPPGAESEPAWTPPPAACSPRLEGAREAHALAAREYERAAAATSPVLAARIFESVPRLFVDLSDTNEPTFDPEFVRKVAIWPRKDGAIVFDQALLGRIRALSRTHDVTDSMDAKANSLVQLVTTPSTPAGVRRTALAALSSSNIYLNQRAAREFLETQLTSPANDEDAVLLLPTAHAYFAGGAHPKRDRAAQVALLQSWVADIPQRLAAAPSDQSVRLVADRLHILGVSGAAFGVDARKLLDDIVSKKGDFPLVRGHREWARTIHAMAAAARFDVDHPAPGMYHATDLYAFDDGHAPSGELLRGPLAGEGEVDAASRAARRRDLEAETAKARYDEARCYLLEETAAAASPAEADARFEEVLAPVFAGPHVDLRGPGDRLCRVRAALGMRDVSASRRNAAVARILRDAKPYLQEVCGNIHAIHSDETMRFELLFEMLAQYPEVIDTSAEVRAWLFANGNSAAIYSAWIYASGQRLFRRAIAHAGPAESPAVKRMLEGWLEDAAADHEHDRSVFAFEHIYALIGAYAGTYGLRDPARRLLTKPEATGLNAPLFSFSRGRAAGIALLDL